MPIRDIRPLKASMREYYKNLRRHMPPEDKRQRDHHVARRVTSLWQYKQCALLLTYVSTAIEVDTLEIISRALADGKVVAVPRCVPDSTHMEFYRIRGLDDLSPGSFGVLEPKPEIRNLIKDFANSLCLVPALCYDWKGYRLGYGKGYYDRFLSHFDGRIIGISYSQCVQRKLPHGRFDRPVELLVTEDYLRLTSR